MTIKTQHRVVIAAGGTGGHIFPAQALAEELIAKGENPILVCDKRTDKFVQGPFKDIEKYYIKSNNFSGSLLTKLLCIFKLMFSIIKVKSYFKKIKPSVVVGFGGYPALPAMLASVSLDIPTVIHEQNSVMGRVNRFVAPHVNKIALGFPKTRATPEKASPNTVHIGNPVRKEFLNLKKSKNDNKFRLLVVGGSQGAKILSDVVPDAIKLLPKKIQSHLIIHQQVRENLVDTTLDSYKGISAKIEVKSFYEDVANLMNECDLVISRAGASSVTEITVLAKPSVLVPFAQAKDNHQFYNAEYLVDNKAGVLIEEKSLATESLSKAIQELIEDKKTLASMGRNAGKLAKTNAAKKLLEIVEKVSA